MANPYHDAQGRFSSKEGMANLVTELRDKSLHAATETERAAAMDEWMTLKVAYDNLANGNVVVPEEFLRRNRLTISPTEDSPETIETAYFSSMKRNLGDTGWDPHSFHSLLVNPKTPQNVRDDILDGLGDSQRVKILEAARTNERLSLARGELLRVAGQINSPEKARALFLNKSFDYPDLREIARSAGGGQIWDELAASRPEFIPSEPDLRQRVLQYAENTKNPEYARLHAFATIGRYTLNPSDQRRIIDHPDFRVHSGEYGRSEINPGLALAENYHLDPRVANDLLRRTRDTSIERYYTVESAIRKTRDNGGDVRHVSETPRLESSTVLDGEKVNYNTLPRERVISEAESAELKDLAATLATAKPGAFGSAYDRSSFHDSDAQVARYVSLQAKEDAQRDNFVALLKEMKRLRRSKASRTTRVSMARRISYAYLMGHIQISD
jgi:hypothetical protein